MITDKKDGIVSASTGELLTIWTFDNDLFQLMPFAEWVKWCRIEGVHVDG